MVRVKPQIFYFVFTQCDVVDASRKTREFMGTEKWVDGVLCCPQDNPQPPDGPTSTPLVHTFGLPNSLMEEVMTTAQHISLRQRLATEAVRNTPLGALAINCYIVCQL